MFAFLMIIMILGPFLPHIDPELHKHLVWIKGDDIKVPPYPPSIKYPFGSTEDGTDLLSLIVLGTRDTFILVFEITIIRYLIAVPLGLAASRKKGPFHWILTGWNNVFSALPPLFSAILLLTAPFLLFNSHRLMWAMFLIALVEAGRVGYIIQQQSYAVSQRLYIDAVKTLGLKPSKIYYQHYLPVLLPEIIVLFFIDLGRVLLLIGQLGIFSIFISEKWVQTGFSNAKLVNLNHNWATLLASARGNILAHFWIGFFPAFAIAFSIFAFNLLGEGLRQFFSAHSR